MTGRRFKRFPPGRGELLVPMGPRVASRAAIALYAACRPRARVAQRAAWEAVRLAGARALPGPAVAWDPPLPLELWRGLEARWRRDLGAWDAVAILGRAQPERAGVALLLLAGGTPLAFVKLRPEGAALAREEAALEAVAAYAPGSFAAPAPLAAGEVAGWRWLATTAMPPRLHRPPVDPPLDEILAEVETALAALARPPGTPPEWGPMHGDFTPWNLREVPREGLWLLDWEEAGWGPPGADRVLYRATAAALNGGRPAEPAEPADRGAAAFWRSARAGRSATTRDRRLEAAVDRALGAIEAAPGASVFDGRARGVWAVVLGPDGSGKSAVLDGIAMTLAPSFAGIRRFHLRPHLGGRARPGKLVTDPHGRSARGALLSWAKLGVWALDYWLGYALRVKPALARGSLVLFDRYYHDLLVDPLRYRYAGPRGVTRLVGRVIPRPDLVLVLDAPVETLRARKREVTTEESVRQRQAYRRLAATIPEARVLDAGRPLAEVVAEGAEIVKRRSRRWR